MSHSRQAAAYLANIAYTDEGLDLSQYAQIKADIATALSKIPTGSDTNGPWTLVWGPAMNDGILLYVAQGVDGSLGLSFRGTNVDGDVISVIENVYFDLDVLEQVPWQYALDSGMHISAGTNLALTLAIAAVDPATQTTVLDYLRKAGASGADITVTGHSLGGGLAVVGAAWLQSQLPATNSATCTIFPYTFAAPTICDANFATFFPTAFPSYYAAVNSNDIVPMAWADLGAILETYLPYVTGEQVTATRPAVRRGVVRQNRIGLRRRLPARA